jgi:hypothetical protein
MRAEIEVHRDDEGRLVGELGFGNHQTRSFIGVIELVGLIERSLETDRSDPPRDEGQPQ